MEMHHFCVQNGPFLTNNFFFKIIYIILIYLLVPFILQNLKKILPAEQELYGQFQGPKWPISPNVNFFRFFFKKSSCHTHLYMTSNIKLSFRKNYRSNPKKTYGQMERGIDRPYFTGPFQPRPGIQQQVAGGNTPNLVFKRMQDIF